MPPASMAIRLIIQRTMPGRRMSLPAAAMYGVSRPTSRLPTLIVVTSFSRVGDEFGRSVAISGDTLVVGATEEDSNATGINGDPSDNSALDSGAVYVFTRSGTTWSQQAYLKASNTGRDDLFASPWPFPATRWWSVRGTRTATPLALTAIRAIIQRKMPGRRMCIIPNSRSTPALTATGGTARTATAKASRSKFQTAVTAALSWWQTIYSYDDMGNQIFLIAIGTVNGNTAEVEVFITKVDCGVTILIRCS